MYTYDQLCVTHFVSDALHNDSASDHAGQNYVVYILQRTKHKVNAIITYRTKAALKYSGLQNYAYKL